MSSDDELFALLGERLGSRPDWNFEPSTTPGAQPSWCFDPHGEITISVSLVEGAITIYLPNLDREIAVDDLDALSAWMDANESRLSGR